jgi:uncharacterized protein YqeY
MDKRTELMDAMKTSMKAGDSMTTNTIRLIIAKMKEADIEFRGAGKGDKVSDDALLSMMQGMIKQRQESSKIYKDNGRPELAATEDGEIAAIMKFLPQQMDDAGIEQTVVKLLADLNVTEAKDMGKVMAALKTDYAGQLDMGKASALVKKKLAG